MVRTQGGLIRTQDLRLGWAGLDWTLLGLGLVGRAWGLVQVPFPLLTESELRVSADENSKKLGLP